MSLCSLSLAVFLLIRARNKGERVAIGERRGFISIHGDAAKSFEVSDARALFYRLTGNKNTARDALHIKWLGRSEFIHEKRTGHLGRGEREKRARWPAEAGGLGPTKKNAIAAHILNGH